MTMQPANPSGCFTAYPPFPARSLGRREDTYNVLLVLAIPPFRRVARTQAALSGLLATFNWPTRRQLRFCRTAGPFLLAGDDVSQGCGKRRTQTSVPSPTVIEKGNPRLCRGNLKSLTVPGVAYSLPGVNRDSRPKSTTVRLCLELTRIGNGLSLQDHRPLGVLLFVSSHRQFPDRCQSHGPFWRLAGSPE